MSELLRKVIVGIIRVLMIPFTTWLMQHNILTNDESVKFAAEVATYAITIGWTAYAYIRAHRKTLTALVMPKGTTLKELDAQIKTGETPSVMTGKTETPKMPSWLLPILCVTAGLLASGCTPKAAPQLPTSLPAIVESADRDINAASIKALRILKAAGTVVKSVVLAEAELVPAMSAGTIKGFHEPFKAAANKLALQALDAIDAIDQGAAVTWPELKARLEPILASAGALVDLVHAQLPAAVEGKSGFRVLSESIWMILSTLPLPTLREPAQTSSALPLVGHEFLPVSVGGY